LGGIGGDRRRAGFDDSQDVVFVERRVKRRAAVARRAERHALAGHRHIWPGVVVRGDELVDVDQLRRIGRLPGHGVITPGGGGDKQGSYVRIAQRVDQRAGNAWRLEPLQRVTVQLELGLYPAGEGAQGSNSPGQAGRRRLPAARIPRSSGRHRPENRRRT